MPVYKFYQNAKGSKLEETINSIEGFRLLELHNLTIIPFDQRFHLKIEVSISNSPNVKTFLLTQLYHNPKLEPHLFFVNGNVKFKAIPLPDGSKDLKFKIIAFPGAGDFELNLACEYQTGLSKTIRS